MHSPESPAGTTTWPGTAPEGPGGILIHQKGQREGPARSLTGLEVWRLQGLLDAEWHDRLQRGVGESTLVREAIKQMPQRTADALVSWVLDAEASEPPPAGKAGGPSDPEESRAWGEVSRWLRAWQQSPHCPSSNYSPPNRQPPPLPEDLDQYKAGGVTSASSGVTSGEETAFDKVWVGESTGSDEGGAHAKEPRTLSRRVRRRRRPRLVPPRTRRAACAPQTYLFRTKAPSAASTTRPSRTWRRQCREVA